MNASLESRLARIKFSLSPVGADRIHYVNEGDVRVVLGRLPLELWDRLRAVHFNDHSRGARVPGYVTQGHREIALCALPPRMTLRAFLMKGQTPEQFGAERGHKWPALAIRRFMLYDTFLHELGHLQLVNENGHSARLKFAREKLAQNFANQWRTRLWSTPFLHTDPVHNPPAVEAPKGKANPVLLHDNLDYRTNCGTGRGKGHKKWPGNCVDFHHSEEENCSANRHCIRISHGGTPAILEFAYQFGP